MNSDVLLQFNELYQNDNDYWTSLWYQILNVSKSLSTYQNVYKNINDEMKEDECHNDSNYNRHWNLTSAIYCGDYTSCSEAACNFESSDDEDGDDGEDGEDGEDTNDSRKDGKYDHDEDDDDDCETIKPSSLRGIDAALCCTGSNSCDQYISTSFGDYCHDHFSSAIRCDGYNSCDNWSHIGNPILLSGKSSGSNSFFTPWIKWNDSTYHDQGRCSSYGTTETIEFDIFCLGTYSCLGQYSWQRITGFNNVYFAMDIQVVNG